MSRLLISCLFCLFFLSGALKAQTDFRPGYVIKETGDTVMGEIDYRGDLLMAKVCTFRPNGKNSEVKYMPGEIAGFRFIDSKYYVSREVEGTQVFLEYLLNGQMSIFFLRNDSGDFYYVEKEGMPLTKVPYEEELKRENGRTFLYKSKDHVGILSYFMKDAPDFQSRISSIEKPSHQNLVKLGENYHNRVCEGEKCIIYEKKVPFFKANVEVAGGFVNYMNQDYYIDKNYTQGGILGHIWMPGVNEKLFIRTGIIYSTFETENTRGALYKIPFQVEYLYPKGRIKPKIAYGINLYKPLYQSVAFMGGLNVKLLNKISLSLNYDLDFMPSSLFPLVPRKMLSNSFTTGLYIEL